MDGYVPLQAAEIVSKLNFTPRWFIDCGPGDGREFDVFKERWPDLYVIGIEPSISAFTSLQSRFPGILLNVAVSGREGRVRLLNPTSSLNASIIRSPDDYSGADGCQCVTLQTLDRIYGPNDAEYRRIENAFVWADIEGSELAMLDGAKEMIKNRQIRGFNLEVHDGENEQRTDTVMTGYGFSKIMSYQRNGFHHDNLYLDMR